MHPFTEWLKKSMKMVFQNKSWCNEFQNMQKPGSYDLDCDFWEKHSWDLPMLRRWPKKNVDWVYEVSPVSVIQGCAHTSVRSHPEGRLQLGIQIWGVEWRYHNEISLWWTGKVVTCWKRAGKRQKCLGDNAVGASERRGAERMSAQQTGVC